MESDKNNQKNLEIINEISEKSDQDYEKMMNTLTKLQNAISKNEKISNEVGKKEEENNYKNNQTTNTKMENMSTNYFSNEKIIRPNTVTGGTIPIQSERGKNNTKMNRINLSTMNNKTTMNQTTYYPISKTRGNKSLNRSKSSRTSRILSNNSENIDNGNINNIVSNIEEMIHEIKFNGFSKVKQIIKEKQILKMHLTNSIESLKNQIKVMNSETKKFGANNTKLLNEASLFQGLGEQAYRELYFLNKNSPTMRDDINNVFKNIK
jgi:hypothetical protein